MTASQSPSAPAAVVCWRGSVCTIRSLATMGKASSRAREASRIANSGSAPSPSPGWKPPTARATSVVHTSVPTSIQPPARSVCRSALPDITVT